MTCDEAETLIQKELDGEELTQAERRALAAHLERCPRCSSLRTGLSRLVAAVKELPLPAAPEVDLARSAARALRRRRRRVRLAVGAGLAAAAAGLLLLLVLRPAGSRPARPPVGSTAPPPMASAPSAPTSAPPGAPGQPALNPEAALGWLETAWERAAARVAGTLPTVEVPLPPEETAWPDDLLQTADALRQLTREVGARILPFTTPKEETDRRNG